MKRPKHILTRDDIGRQLVILELEAEEGSGEQPAIRYELANRSAVTRISDAEFVVAQTGQVLTRTTNARGSKIS